MSMFSAAQIQAASGAIAAARVASDKRAERKQPTRSDGQARGVDEVVLNVPSAQGEQAMHATKREHDEDSPEEEAARQDALDEHGVPKRPAQPRLDVQG